MFSQHQLRRFSLANPNVGFNTLTGGNVNISDTLTVANIEQPQPTSLMWASGTVSRLFNPVVILMLPHFGDVTVSAASRLMRHSTHYLYLRQSVIGD